MLIDGDLLTFKLYFLSTKVLILFLRGLPTICPLK